MANFQIPAPPSDKRPKNTYEWFGAIIKSLQDTKGVDWNVNNTLNIKELGNSIGNDRNFVATVDRKILESHNPIKLAPNTDLNTLTNNGIYTSDSDGNSQTLVNRPPGTQGFILRVYRVWNENENSYRTIQIAYNRTTGFMYSRGKSESTDWTNWVGSLYTTDATSANSANKLVIRDNSGNFSAGTITASLNGNASTATKLQTARTVNGTSFDGSKDIITNQWGTQRTLTIGNSGKPVNGSTNVTWSLAEIGAAPITNAVQHWTCSVKCATWSRILSFTDSNTYGHTGIVTLQATRASVVYNVTLLINFSHSSRGTIVQLSNTSYSNLQVRSVVANNGYGYLEIYDNANNATNTTTQTFNISYLKLSNTSATLHTSFVDGSSVPSGYSVGMTMTTVSGANYVGNASTATKLQTARTVNGTSFDGSKDITTTNWGTARNITIGNTTRSVNGSVDVGWSLTDIGAAPTSHNHSSLTGVTSLIFAAHGTDLAYIKTTISDSATYLDMFLSDDSAQDKFRWRFLPHSDNTSLKVERSLMELDCTSASQHSAKLTVFGEIISTAQNGLRIVNGNYGLIMRNDGNNTYFLLTASGQQYGEWNSLRPFSINNSTGKVTFGNGITGALSIDSTVTAPTFSGSLSGNASSTTKLATARRLTIGSTGKTFDGTTDVNWTLNEIGALPFSGGTMTGSIKYSGGGWTGDAIALEPGTSNGAFMGLGAGGLTVIGSGESTKTIKDNYTTDFSTEVMIIGSDNQIEFFTGIQNGYANKKTVRITASGVIEAPQGMTGNASTATKLATARKLTIGSTGKTFDGTTDVNWTLNEIGALPLAGGTMSGDIQMNERQIKLTTVNSGYARIGYESSTKDVYISNYNNNWLRITSNATMTIAGYKVYAANNKPSPAEIGAAAELHTHSYLPLSGGTMTGTITSSLSTSSHLDGNKGKAIINSTAPGTGYNMLARMKSTNGVWMFGSSGNEFNLYYTADSTISAGSNAYTKQLKLLNESGNSYFPGTVTAPSFSGPLLGNASTATTLRTARNINGTSFDGSKDITTTSWGTARNITIGNTTRSVNGSGNVSWTLTDIGALASTVDSMITIGKKIQFGTSTAYLQSDTSPILSSQANISIIADSDASASTEYVSIKSGHNELKVISSGGRDTVIQGNDKLTFNGHNVYHAGNKPSANDVGALALSGGQLTGNLTFSDSGTSLRGIQGKMAANDYWRVMGGGTGNDSGYLEIATCDNGDEPIYVRQYTGDSETSFKTLVRSATLLDENGNTHFPGIMNIGGRRLACIASHGGLDVGDTNVAIAMCSKNQPIWYDGSITRELVYSVKDSGGYPCMMSDNNGWIRTPPSGIIPNTAGTGSGRSKLGSPTWTFSDGYINEVHCNGVKRDSGDLWLTGNGGSGNIVVQGHAIPSDAAVKYLGKSANRWHSVWAANGTIQTSDERFKVKQGLTNIEECFDMIKNTNIYNYIMIGQNKEDLSKNRLGKLAMEHNKIDSNIHMGVMAQDILAYDCARQIIIEDEYERLDGTTDTMLSINPYNLTSALMGALKVEISKREELETTVNKQENEISDLQTELTELRNEVSELKELVKSFLNK